MSALPRSLVCDRVRAQVSLRLDGELSQLESRMLDAHLARCAECRAYEAAVTAVTNELRAAPLEPLPRPIAVRRPRRLAVAARLQAGIAAALALAVVGLATQLGPRETEPGVSHPGRFDTAQQLTREVNQIIAGGRAFERHGAAIPL
ncbi:MAG TPA: zf-HC2 domain-containing protein [Gaiellaceae bacterium]|nr:zf-HC2 domain-containing protein [Gaiellaceae bacterium]